MTLAIDPRDPGRTRLVLMDGRRIVATRDVADKDGMLAAVEKILAGRGGAGKLKRIGVVTGGGSFSGVRQGVVIARAMAFCLGIPARAFRWRGEEPTAAEIASAGAPLTRVAYAGTPNITMPKRRTRR
ncbi:hypothetical protein EPO33_00990 [Patescibacteria group bacterium]|nr:MAG: hypothetical protein EPO33_00990 [Patescibacteria group bacterium]